MCETFVLGVFAIVLWVWIWSAIGDDMEYLYGGWFKWPWGK